MARNIQSDGPGRLDEPTLAGLPPLTGNVIMTAEGSHEKKMATLAASLVDAWNSYDLERVADFYASNFEGIDVAQAKPQQGPAGIRYSVTRYWQAFPDLHFTMNSIVVQENQVALFWTARGTHRGRLMNIPPTGRSVEVQGVTLLTVIGGKISRASYIWDVAGLLRSIGLLPDL